MIGDGEAETGSLATAPYSIKFLDTATDGAVLPILHLIGYKIASATIHARINREELDQSLRGYSWTHYFVDGFEPALRLIACHRQVIEARSFNSSAREAGDAQSLYR